MAGWPELVGTQSTSPRLGSTCIEISNNLYCLTVLHLQEETDSISPFSAGMWHELLL